MRFFGKRRLASTLAWLWLVAAAAICVTQFRASADITEFLPDHADPEQGHIARHLARSDLAHSMILLVEGPGREQNAAVARELANRLRDHEEVAWLRAGLDAATEASFRDLFFAARFGFLSADPENELPVALSDEGLAAKAREVKELLATPLGASVAATLAEDPLVAFHEHLLRVESARPATLGTEDGQLVIAETGDAVLFLGTRSSPFEAKRQRVFLADLDDAFAEVTQDHTGVFRLRKTGVNRFAVSAEESTRADVERISIVSTLGTLLLLLVAFRSLRYLLLVAVPIAFGFASGLAACLVVFDSVHGMTLAFGSALIGVSVDYTIHFFNHHTQSPNALGPHQSLAAVWGGMALGAVTTIAGFLAMAWAASEGMRQIAVFGIAGITTALLATRVVLPTWMPRAPRPVKLLGRASRSIERAMAFFRLHRKALAVVPALAVLACAWKLPSVIWNDDPAALASYEPGLTQEDEEIRGRISAADPGRFLAVWGESWEEALVRNARAYRALEEAVAAGELEHAHSMQQILWSLDLQRRNLEALWRSPALGERLDAAFAREGFRPGAFAEFATVLAGPKPEPVTMAKMTEAGLESWVRGLYAADESGVLLLSPLSKVSDPEALLARFDDLEGAAYFDQGRYMRGGYEGFRTSVLGIVTFSLLLVWALVWLRYRSFRMGLAAFLPAVLAAATTLVILSTAGVELNLLHLLGLMLVLSMGVDYAIFVVESVEQRTGTGEAMVGTIISCATTILSFGLLAMSANPGLQALGSMVALGNTLSLVMAPVALVVLGLRS